MTARRALVVGTAGHIDHGKTSLVRALTGVDLDRLPEERARGITIALGFTELALPDGRRASFVDVPGHERLVRTMIAGATGLDAVILCVSAVDGAMPQTREHLAVLDLLGVRHGVVALTMADLVDAELLELAIEDVRSLVAGTFLGDAPIVPFSSVTGQGKDALLDAISAVPDTTRTEAGPFRMPIDRVFVRTGFGVVATGTVISGALRDGEQVQLLPDGLPARVRGIQVHGEDAERATPGHRTALNLAGVDAEAVARGQVVVRGAVATALVCDVRYRPLPSAEDLEDGAEVRVLHGTTERGARLHWIEEGEWAQLRLDAPLPALPGDRFVARRSSPAETLGGGHIVDPWAKKVRHRDLAERRERLVRLDAGDPLAWLEGAGDEGLTRADLEVRGVPPEVAVALADRMLAPAAADALGEVAVEQLAAFHRAHPLARGAPRRDLRRGRLLALSERAFDALLDRLVATGRAELDGPLVRAHGRRVELDAAQRALRERVLAAVGEAGLEGRGDKDLAELGPDAVAIARLLEADDQLGDVPGLGWVLRAELAALEDKVRGWFAAHDAMTPTEFKDLTGLTRRAAIPLLEWLDKRRVTRRDGDRRLRGVAG